MSKRTNFFWASYSDLMTSLFFIMLVLFVLTVVLLRKQAQASQDAISKINQVVEALKDLDSSYFAYDEQSMRYRLKIDVRFRPNDDNIASALNFNQRQELVEAGKSLHSLMTQVVSKNDKINYLLIVEGNTQRVLNPSGWNHIVMPDVGYQLSYRRALALINFWKQNNIDFSQIENCEVLVSGSGYFGKSRDPMVTDRIDSDNNRKFTIQISPKIGKIETQ